MTFEAGSRPSRRRRDDHVRQRAQQIDITETAAPLRGEWQGIGAVDPMVDEVEMTSCQSLGFARIPDWRGSRDDSDTITASSIPIISSGATEGRAVKLYNGAKCCRIRKRGQFAAHWIGRHMFFHRAPVEQSAPCIVQKLRLSQVRWRDFAKKWPMVMKRVRDYAATRLGALPEFRKKARENAIDACPPPNAARQRRDTDPFGEYTPRQTLNPPR